VKILIGMETSGAIRRAFAARGWHAVSVDLLPSDDVPLSGPWRTQQHWIGDVRDYIDRDWDMFIFHPDCTYLTNSAEWAYKDVQKKKIKPGTLIGAARREAREKSVEEIHELWSLSKHIPKRCMENPIGTLSTRFRKPDQILQPYGFGEDASKATCLWLDGLDPLQPTRYIPPRIVHGKKRWANQTDSGQNRLAPSADRWKKRAATYPGIAAAMALQWGNT
jgi:hypothetical protein